MVSHPIKVLIVDDSPLATELLTRIIHSDPDLKVIGCVDSGERALNFIKWEIPDVITMDIVMPKMDGFETTRRIMQTTPIPIVIISACFKGEDVQKSFEAIDAGALDILEKPPGPQDPDFDTLAKRILKSIKTVAGTKLIARHYSQPHSLSKPKLPDSEAASSLSQIEAIAIGSSLGGPHALRTIFKELPAQFRLPIFVVQHISPGFAPGFTEWLGEHTPLHVKLAQKQEIAQSGCIYIAPDHHHLEIHRGHLICLATTPPERGLRPAVGHLFRSMAKTYGAHGMGIILTGMGRDGVEDLLLMKQSGALTVAQDKESSLLFGMPKEAIAIGAAQRILSLQQIAELLKLINKS
jgi:two-component system chemotaxis response regulator CheB